MKQKALIIVLLFSFLNSLGENFLIISASASPSSRGINIVIKDTSGRQIGLYKESHALVVGVSKYRGGWPSLPGVKKDVKAVKIALEKQGFHVVMVEDPNQSELEKAYKDFIFDYGLDPDNRLLFYFAGHGYTHKPSYASDDPEEWMGYVISRDAPRPEDNLSAFLRHAMSMQAVHNFALQIEAKHALFMFDSCFSGSIFALNRAIPQVIMERTAKPVRQFISSGSADQEVPDKSEFRRQFIIALEGEADQNHDGYVTGSELGLFIEEKVTNYSRGAQNPQYGKIRHRNLDKGDFIFITSASGNKKGDLTKGQKTLEANRSILILEKKQFEMEKQLEAERIKLAIERQHLAEEKTKLEKKLESFKKDTENTVVASLRTRIGNFIKLNNQTAIDRRTGLMWMTKDFRNIEGRAPKSWDEAIAWVEKINRKGFAGYNDWRAPTIDEYRAIYSPARGRLAFDRDENNKVGYPESFEDGGGYWAWSSSEADSLSAKLFIFIKGFENVLPKKHSDNFASVRLVRSTQ